MRILVVEDDKSLSMVLCELLRQEGYRADTAFSGDTGLDCALSGIYDVIVLDVMLPKMDGFAVLRGLRQAGIRTPVLMLTARTQIEDKVTGLDSGADDYLTKPFNTTELLARIRALSRRSSTEFVDSSIQCNDIVLHKETHEVQCGSKSIKLTSKEADILEMFAKSHGRVVSKDMLTLKIWGYDSEIEYNSTEVYISFLRKKLKSIGSQIKIKAVRGVGYLLEEPNANGN